MTKVRDVQGCKSCPMLFVDCHYQDKNGQDVHHLGQEQTFVAPQRGDAPRLQVLEAPGETESLTGVPATGGAGTWLNIINRSVGLKREELNIANVIQCRPPNNIFPTAGEAAFYISKEDGERAVQHCFQSHLQPLLRERQWKRIDIFGDTPLKYVVGKTGGILKWRGSPLAIPGVSDKPITVPTVHPAYVMRNQLYSRVASADLAKGLQVPPENYNLRPDLEDVKRFIATKFSYDIETTWGADKIFMVGLSDKPFHAIVVPFQGPYIDELKRIFKNAASVVGQNSLQFDAPVLKKFGVDINPEAEHWDVMLCQHLLYPDLPHDLEFIGSQFCQKPAWKGGMKEDFELYCARDTDVTLQCFEQLYPRLVRQGLLELYENVQVPLAKICHLMQTTGFAVNPKRILDVRKQLIGEMQTFEGRLPVDLRTRTILVNKRELAPQGTKSPKTGKPLRYFTKQVEEQEVPWQSNKIVERWLYEDSKLPVQLHPKTQQRTTDKGAIAKIHRRLLSGAIKSEVPGIVDAVAALGKLRKTATLVNSFMKQEMADVGRMHPHFNVHGTASGRLSSSDPNLQNIPETARYIYVPSYPDWVIVEADYSGIENRLTALFANDIARLGRLAEPGYNEHKWMTSQYFGIPYELVEKDNDKDAPYWKAKRIGHGCNYGMGVQKICNLFDMEYQEVKELHARWKEINADTVRWQTKTAAEAKKTGVLTTAFGRKRWFWTSSVYTESLSFLPQSAGADVIFRAMIGLMYERIGWPVEKVMRVVERFEALPEPARLLLQVHDSLIVECPEVIVDQVVKTMKYVMEQPVKELGGYSIPVEFKVGKSWGEAEGI